MQNNKKIAERREQQTTEPLPIIHMVKTEVITGIDNCETDQLHGIIRFFMKMRNLPSTIVEKAKQIDGENFEPDCFGFCFSYHLQTNTYTILKKNGKAVYYLDENGDLHYMDYEIPDKIKTSAISKCNKELQRIGIKKKRKSPAAVSNSNRAVGSKIPKTAPYSVRANETGSMIQKPTSSTPLYLICQEEARRVRRCVYGQLSIFPEYAFPRRICHRTCTKKEAISRKHVYTYGGKHFIPHSKLGNVTSLCDIMLRSDLELGFFDRDYPGREMKHPYSYKEFYKAMGDSQTDIFYCIETQKLYIPCEHELFIYEGKR